MNFFPGMMPIPNNMNNDINMLFDKIAELDNRVKRLEKKLKYYDDNSFNKDSKDYEPDNSFYMI